MADRTSQLVPAGVTGPAIRASRRTSQLLPDPSPFQQAIAAELAARAEGPTPLPAVVPVPRAPNPALRQTGMPAYEFPLGNAIAAAIARNSNVVAKPAPEESKAVVKVTPARSFDIAQMVGDAARAAAPNSLAARQATTAAIQDRFNQGDYIGAAGRAVGGLGTAAAGLVNDAIRGPVALDSALDNASGRFVRGLFGMGPARAASTTDAIIPSAAAATPGGGATVVIQPAPERAQGVDAVNAAMNQGRNADGTPITPQDALSQFITQAFQGGASFNELKDIGQLVPAAVKQTQSAKDRVIGTAAAMADDSFAKAYEAAQKITDPVESAKAMQLARQTYETAYAALAGIDPTKTALAEKLRGAGDE